MSGVLNKLASTFAGAAMLSGLSVAEAATNFPSDEDIRDVQKLWLQMHKMELPPQNAANIALNPNSRPLSVDCSAAQSGWSATLYSRASFNGSHAFTSNFYESLPGAKFASLFQMHGQNWVKLASSEGRMGVWKAEGDLPVHVAHQALVDAGFGYQDFGSGGPSDNVDCGEAYKFSALEQ